MVFFFQAEDGIRDLVRSRGLGDVYKRQVSVADDYKVYVAGAESDEIIGYRKGDQWYQPNGTCLLYTSDAADERSSVDLGGRRIIKKKKHQHPADTVYESHRTTTKMNRRILVVKYNTGKSQVHRR